MANVYKKTTYKEIQNRKIEKVDIETKNSVNLIISKFVDYFKLKHISQS